MNKKGFTLVETLLSIIAVVAIAFLGMYIFNSIDDFSGDNSTQHSAADTIEDSTSPDAVASTEKQEESSEPETTNTLTSELYPELSFVAPKGWSLSEPTSYDGSTAFNAASAEISISNGSSSIVLEMKTEIATGFPGYDCQSADSVVSIDDSVVRVNQGGAVSYLVAKTPQSSDWKDVLQGEFTSTEQGSDYCVAAPIIDTFKSTVRTDSLDDLAGLSANNAESEVLWAWLMGIEASGTLSSAELEQMDAIVESISSL